MTYEEELAFKRWYEAAREIEPFLSRGISEKDIFWVGYQAGRDAMREEAMKVCGDFDIPDVVEGAHPDYVEGKRMAVAQIAYKIGTLK
jgi:hypothetical protein